MPERNLEHIDGWYKDDDGFAETLQEMIYQIEDRNPIITEPVAKRISALKEEISKFKPA